MAWSVVVTNKTNWPTRPTPGRTCARAFSSVWQLRDLAPSWPVLPVSDSTTGAPGPLSTFGQANPAFELLEAVCSLTFHLLFQDHGLTLLILDMQMRRRRSLQEELLLCWVTSTLLGTGSSGPHDDQISFCQGKMRERLCLIASGQLHLIHLACCQIVALM